MKTKQIKGKVDILLVDDVLPIGYKSVEDTLANGVTIHLDNGYADSWYLPEIFDKNNWEFLSTIENLTGDAAHSIVGQKAESISPIQHFIYC